MSPHLDLLSSLYAAIIGDIPHLDVVSSTSEHFESFEMPPGSRGLASFARLESNIADGYDPRLS